MAAVVMESVCVHGMVRCTLCDGEPPMGWIPDGTILYDDNPVKVIELEPGRLKPRTRRDIKASKNHSRAQELNLAKRFQASGFPEARRVPASGAFRSLPGDVDPQEWFLAEAKMTRSGRMVVQPAWVQQIRKQAAEMGRPWYCLHTWTADGEDQYTKLVTVAEDTFFELLRRVREAEAELAAYARTHQDI